MHGDSVDLVRIRAAVFIPDAWISRSRSDDGGPTVEYRGDDREFTRHAVDVGRSRVEQAAVVDFEREDLLATADTSRSVERVTRPDGSEETRTGRADADGVFCTDPAWREDGVAFEMHASASNPLVTHPDPVDYAVAVTVGRDGTVEVTGRHDGFPCFEWYAQVDFDEFRTVYRHDHREAGETNAALAGPMDYEFERTLRPE